MAMTRQPSGVLDGDEPRYSCQATQMYEATESLAWWDVRQYLFDVVTGNHSVGRVLRVLFLSSLRLVLGHRLSSHQSFQRVDASVAKWTSDPFIKSSSERGSPDSYGSFVFSGWDYVQINAKSEIQQTLNHRNRNRGLLFDFEEMASYCGAHRQGAKSVTKIIDEPTGKMLTMKEPCIMLDGVVCNSEYARQRLNCPWAIPSYWREIWLRRVSEPAPSEVIDRLPRD